MMHRIALFLFCVLFSQLLQASWSDNPANAAGADPSVNHALWDTLLQRHVSKDGFVDYQGFKRDSVQFNQYLALLSAAHPKTADWSRAEKMAFWINAYNAFTVKLIIDNYPVVSIRDIKSGNAAVSSVWDIPFIRIGGATYSLNNIEHNILRSEFKDARVHASINCASYSCPALRNEAFTAEKLEAQLTDAMRKFVNDPRRNKVSTKKAEISEIFKWFHDDFTRDAKTVRNFLNRYADKKLDANGRITYLDYDWNLNEAK